MCPTVQVGYVEAHLSVTKQISIQLLMLLSVCLRIDLMQKKKKKPSSNLNTQGHFTLKHINHLPETGYKSGT